MPAQRGPATSRRTAIAGAAAGLLASACDAGAPGPDPAPAPSSTAPPDPADPDAVLAADAALLVADRLALARALGERYPALGPRLRPFVALHRAHASVLLPPAEEPDAPAVTGGAHREVGLFRAGEAAAAQRLAGWAVRADSGALARLLASMSAGVSARLAADAAVDTAAVSR